MKTKTFDRVVYGLGILAVVSIGAFTYTKATSEKLYLHMSERIIDGLYSYNDMETLLSNTESIRELCNDDIFTLLDSSNKANLSRRFAKYTPTKAGIKSLIAKDDEVHAIVSFNRESNLPDKYIEYDFARKYEKDYDYLGGFEESLNPPVSDGH